MDRFDEVIAQVGLKMPEQKYWERATLEQLFENLRDEDTTSSSVLNVLRRLIREIEELKGE
jgi:hypothetical protein